MWIEVVAPDRTNSHCIFQSICGGKRSQFHLTISLLRAVKSINFIKLQLLNTCLLKYSAWWNEKNAESASGTRGSRKAVWPHRFICKLSYLLFSFNIIFMRKTDWQTTTIRTWVFQDILSKNEPVTYRKTTDSLGC